MDLMRRGRYVRENLEFRDYDPMKIVDDETILVHGDPSVTGAKRISKGAIGRNAIRTNKDFPMLKEDSYLHPTKTQISTSVYDPKDGSISVHIYDEDNHPIF